MITISKLIRSLVIVDENVWTESARQPMLFLEASRLRTDRMRDRMRAEAELEEFEASYGLRVRARGLDGGERVTEGYIKSKIICSPKTKRLKQQLNNAIAEEELCKLLLEAYRMRRDGLEIIARAQLNEGARETAQLEQHVVQRRLALNARQLEKRSK